MPTVNALIVDDEAFVCEALSRVLQKHGVDTVSAKEGREALEILEQQKIDIIITDVKMPVMGGIEFLKEVRQNHPDLPVIVMSGHGDEQIILDALHAGANNFFRKPTNLYVIRQIILPFINLIEEKKSRIIHHKFIERIEYEIRLNNDLTLIPGAVHVLLQNLQNVSQMEELNSLELGLYEILVNALEHGNLEITSEEKEQAQAEQRYSQFLQERLQDPQYQDRTIHVRMEYTSRQASFTITDEGSGFNWRKLPEQFSQDNLFLEHGRGVLMAKLAFDEVRYNEKGNQVTLLKTDLTPPLAAQETETDVL